MGNLRYEISDACERRIIGRIEALYAVDATMPAAEIMIQAMEPENFARPFPIGKLLCKWIREGDSARLRYLAARYLDETIWDVRQLRDASQNLVAAWSVLSRAATERS